MDLTQFVARSIKDSVGRALRQYQPCRKGLVSAVSSSPARVTIKGVAMPYAASYTTPAVGDLVVYSAGPDPVCLGLIAE